VVPSRRVGRILLSDGREISDGLVVFEIVEMIVARR
jgi:hypothetical protein